MARQWSGGDCHPMDAEDEQQTRSTAPATCPSTASASPKAQAAMPTRAAVAAGRCDSDTNMETGLYPMHYNSGSSSAEDEELCQIHRKKQQSSLTPDGTIIAPITSSSSPAFRTSSSSCSFLSGASSVALVTDNTSHTVTGCGKKRSGEEDHQGRPTASRKCSSSSCSSHSSWTCWNDGDGPLPSSAPPNGIPSSELLHHQQRIRKRGRRRKRRRTFPDKDSSSSTSSPHRTQPLATHQAHQLEVIYQPSPVQEEEEETIGLESGDEDTYEDEEHESQHHDEDEDEEKEKKEGGHLLHLHSLSPAAAMRITMTPPPLSRNTNVAPGPTTPPSTTKPPAPPSTTKPPIPPPSLECPVICRLSAYPSLSPPTVNKHPTTLSPPPPPPRLWRQRYPTASPKDKGDDSQDKEMSISPDKKSNNNTPSRKADHLLSQIRSLAAATTTKTLLTPTPLDSLLLVRVSSSSPDKVQTHTAHKDRCSSNKASVEGTHHRDATNTMVTSTPRLSGAQSARPKESGTTTASLGHHHHHQQQPPPYSEAGSSLTHEHHNDPQNHLEISPKDAIMMSHSICETTEKHSSISEGDSAFHLTGHHQDANISRAHAICSTKTRSDHHQDNNDDVSSIGSDDDDKVVLGSPKGLDDTNHHRDYDGGIDDSDDCGGGGDCDERDDDSFFLAPPGEGRHDAMTKTTAAERRQNTSIAVTPSQKGCGVPPSRSGSLAAPPPLASHLEATMGTPVEKESPSAFIFSPIAAAATGGQSQDGKTAAATQTTTCDDTPQSAPVMTLMTPTASYGRLWRSKSTSTTAPSSSLHMEAPRSAEAAPIYNRPGLFAGTTAAPRKFLLTGKKDQSEEPTPPHPRPRVASFSISATSPWTPPKQRHARLLDSPPTSAGFAPTRATFRTNVMEDKRGDAGETATTTTTVEVERRLALRQQYGIASDEDEVDSNDPPSFHAKPCTFFLQPRRREAKASTLVSDCGRRGGGGGGDGLWQDDHDKEETANLHPPPPTSLCPAPPFATAAVTARRNKRKR